MKLIFKSKLGMNLFIETGRVFIEDDIIDSSKWHSSYGGGLYLSYLEDTLVVSTYIAVSPDRVTFSFGFAMAY